MKKQNVIQTYSRRKEQGDKLLQLAGTIDTRAVADRLAAFAEAHRVFVALQRKVEDATQRHLQETNSLSGESDALNVRIDDVAVALIVERRQLQTPFAIYKAPSPSVLKRLPPVKRQRIALNLVAAMRAGITLTPATLAAVTTLEEAALKFANLLGPLTNAEGEVVAARHDRDREGRRWDKALKALRLSAKLAAEDGVGSIYAALFPTAGKSRTGSSEETATPTNPTAASPADTQDTTDTPKAA